MHYTRNPHSFSLLHNAPLYICTVKGDFKKEQANLAKRVSFKKQSGGHKGGGIYALIEGNYELFELFKSAAMALSLDHGNSIFQILHLERIQSSLISFDLSFAFQLNQSQLT